MIQGIVTEIFLLLQLGGATLKPSWFIIIGLRHKVKPLIGR
jgi:hypothetical protein